MRIVLYGTTLHGIKFDWFGRPLVSASQETGGAVGSRLLTIVNEVAMGLLKKADSRAVQGQTVALLKDDKFSKSYPTLWAHLTQNAWDDGTVRETSGLLVFCQDGMLKGMLRDKEAGLCLWMASSSFTGLLEGLEAAVNDPSTEWRVDRQVAGQQAKRTRKGS